VTPRAGRPAGRGSVVALVLALLGLISSIPAPAVHPTLATSPGASFMEAPHAVGPTSVDPNVGSYNVTVQAMYLNPAANFSFLLDGTPYTGVGGGRVVVSGLSSGLHQLTQITAGPAQAGWAYFGQADSGTDVAVPTVSTINLTFAYENMTGAPAAMAFQAVNLPPGTIWQLRFNGSIYSVPTSMINLTVRTGYYVFQALNITSDHGTTQWIGPSLVPPEFVNVTPIPHPLLLNYSALFAIQLAGGTGGTVFLNLQLPNTRPVTNLSAGTYWVPFNTNATIRAIGQTGYFFAGWAGAGIGSYTGPEPRRNLTVVGPESEGASFQIAPLTRSSIRFVENGIPNGTIWSVVLGGRGYASGLNVLAVSFLIACQGTDPDPGNYSLVVPYAYANATVPDLTPGRFIPEPYPAFVCGGSVVTLTFDEQFLVTTLASAGGSTSATFASGSASSGWTAPGTTVLVSATAHSGYTFAGWSGTGTGSYTGSLADAAVVPGSSVREIASFAPIVPPHPPTYSVTYAATPAFDPTATWVVNVNGTDYAGAGPTIIITGVPAGSYAISIGPALTSDGTTRYVPGAYDAQLNVSANLTETTPFSTEYWLSVGASGPGTTSIDSGFVAAGVPLTLGVNVPSGSVFLGWVGAGPGAYTGAVAAVSVIPTGPFEEVATFAPAGASSHDVFRDPLVLGALAAAALAIGAVGTWFILRLRQSPRRPPPSPSSPTPSATARDPSTRQGGSR